MGLEPAELLEHFSEHPPYGFTVNRCTDNTLWFIGAFDLLTTAEPSVQRSILNIPGHRWLQSLLRWPTLFVGTTVSEYMRPGALRAPEQWLADVLSCWQRQTRLLIIKDVPNNSPLLSDADNDWAHDLSAHCVDQGFLQIEGQALAYVPICDANEDAYLARLSYSRRKDIRRKLRSRAQLRVERWQTGDARFDSTQIEQLYVLYEGVYAQSEIHFDKLTPDFFSALLTDERLDAHVFMYYVQDELIGYNLCLVHDNKLVDKYIGLKYPQAREHNLYFVSWMENLAFARERGLTHYIAGWTDPEIKAYLGAQFTLTHHLVWVRNPILRFILKRLSFVFEGDSQRLEAALKGGA